MLSPSSLKSRLINGLIAKPEQIIGCTDEDIQQIQQRRNLVLPKVYVDLMKTIGRQAGQLMRDIDFLFPDVLELNEQAAGILDN